MRAEGIEGWGGGAGEDSVDSSARRCSVPVPSGCISVLRAALVCNMDGAQVGGISARDGGRWPSWKDGHVASRGLERKKRESRREVLCGRHNDTTTFVTRPCGFVRSK